MVDLYITELGSLTLNPSEPIKESFNKWFIKPFLVTIIGGLTIAAGVGIYNMQMLSRDQLKTDQEKNKLRQLDKEQDFHPIKSPPKSTKI